ncbi:MAG TPA: DNA repair protein RecN, partial [Myxococcota bacterium]|nr:DNA repair protein RecN [Myxococcota bacterium]
EDLLRFQLNEIDKLDPQPGEEEALIEELGRLRHAAELATGTREAEELLYSGDDALCARLGRVLGDLQDLCRFDPALEAPVQQLELARTEIEDAARQVRRYAERVRMDPEALAAKEERLHQLRRLLRKYGGSSEMMLEHRRALKEELAALDGAEDSRARLHRSWSVARDQARHLAQELSHKRHLNAEKLGSSITGELQSLGMGDARVLVEVDPLSEQNIGPTGMDRVEFLIATNRGEEPRPLRKVASGGELSRALLALKRTLSGLGPKGLYVFDEVDTGVGGAIAEVIAQKLREVSLHSQVLCITHLPQIAVYGDLHFHVRKGVSDGRTRSAIARLSPTERLEEVARMLGGLKVSEATRHAAAELLKEARA